MRPATIWKFELSLERHQTIMMPVGADIKHVGVQDGTICLWAGVRPDNVMVKRDFYVVGTGHPIPVEAPRYVGTVQQPPYVWHIYE